MVVSAASARPSALFTDRTMINLFDRLLYVDGTATIQLLATFTKSVNAPRPPRTIPSSGRTTTLTVISPSRTPTGRPTKRLRPSPRRSPSRLKSRSANHSPLRRLLVRALTSPSKPIQLIQQPKRKKDLMRKAGILRLSFLV